MQQLLLRVQKAFFKPEISNSASPLGKLSPQSLSGARP